MTDKVLAERLKITKEDLIDSMKDNAVLYTWAGAQSATSD